MIDASRQAEVGGERRAGVAGRVRDRTRCAGLERAGGENRRAAILERPGREQIVELAGETAYLEHRRPHLAQRQTVLQVRRAVGGTE